ncbi:MAG: DnaJ domain-containing protein [Sulfitobacter sp.]|nr:DnaJ domain-containing protein [Sulfitobacter sp.]
MSTDVLVNYYEVLEVSKEANDDQIAEAVKKMRRVWAKRQGLADQERRHEAELRMKHIAEAERTLLDAAKRSQFDTKLANYRPPLPTAGGPATSTGEGWLERAEEFLHLGDAHSANYAAREATTLTPQNDGAWSVRAQTSLLLGNQQDAVFELNEALRINPSDSAHHFDLGTIYESVGQWDSALGAYEHAAQIDPAEQMFKVAQASVHLQTDKPQKALTIMNNVVSVVSDNPAYNFYLAAALHDATLEDWTRLRNGLYVITKAEQIAPTHRNVDRALGLRFDDADLKSGLRELKSSATEAERMKFRLPGRKAMEVGADMGGWQGGIAGIVLGYGMWFIIPLIFFASSPVLGVLATVGVIAFLYKVAYRPVWHWNNKDSKDLQLR